MFSRGDTIAAPATPTGRSAIAIVRVSGPDAHRLARELLQRREPLEPRHATLGTIHITRAGERSALDEAVVTFFPAPRSFTTEDLVEIAVHGSPVLVDAVLRELVARGARLAERGEFTFRAFLNGRIDLTRAEAIADLVDAKTPDQARAAFDQVDGSLAGPIRALDEQLLDLTARLEASLDFAEEGYHFIDPADAQSTVLSLKGQVDALLTHAAVGRRMREGVRVTIAGPTNAGKSSIFNALVGYDRVLVSDTPGTTRDIVSEAIDLNGIPVVLADTAGLRDEGDLLEREGMRRAESMSSRSDVVLVVLDGSIEPPPGALDRVNALDSSQRVIAVSKSDLEQRWCPDTFGLSPAIRTSAHTGAGIAALRAAILNAIVAEDRSEETPLVSNARHIDLLTRASAALARASTLAGDRAPEEVLLLELTTARAAVEEVSGVRTPDDVLAHIFERFCIGK